MFHKHKKLQRRQVLKGMLKGGAVAVGLPLLDVFLNTNGTAFASNAPLPSRFGTWFWGLGVDEAIFVPRTVGAGYDLTRQLSPLGELRKHVNVYTNFNVSTDGKPNLCHYTGWVALRSGIVPAARGDLPGQSLDIPIADMISGGTRFRSLELAATGVPRDSYSFRSADAINPPEISPLEFYKKIFGPEFQDPNSDTFTPDPRIMLRKSVLSGVVDEIKQVEGALGQADRQRLDYYLTSIRELETRLELQLQKPAPAPHCAVPDEPTELAKGLDVELVVERHRLMTDMLVMALACNQSRVFNMVCFDSFSAATRAGSERTHHILTHEEGVDPDTGLQPQSSWFVQRSMEEWAYFVGSLANMPEGDGSLLDNTLVYGHSDCRFAKTHSLDGIPMFTAGRLNGLVKTGLHIDGEGDAGTRLGYTIQRLFGVPLADWGQGSLRTSSPINEMLV
ncbi:DUF1552 domain-containing protein [Seongchinamella unica]|jgi:hypothetical protein|uniref:DUF1552 domain-containing protein n=1 Tax=Seongchinamella unica TaxID=2547392 RepID=A0A4R5LU83_9GAMM|nr:DUF1552 domain-containing protein [Seongchinamella unica]TDG14943.1 DUF1552 domain-containing protein [Seongchinamella unica]